MERATSAAAPGQTAEIIDFEAALLAACGPQLRADLLTEAEMLAQAFAPEGHAHDLEAIAQRISSGSRDAEMGRTRARRLVAALRCLARNAA